MKYLQNLLILSCVLFLPQAVFAQETAANSNVVAMKISFNRAEHKILIELDPAAAPLHVANFKRLILSGFYDGLLVHRTMPDMLVQMGDPLSRDIAQRSEWGSGGNQGAIVAEIRKPLKTGAVAAARLGDDVNPNKNSNSSQFFVALRSLAALPTDYSVFGQVTHGLNALKEMSQTLSDSNYTPLAPPKIVNIRLVTAPEAEAIVAQPASKKAAKKPKPVTRTGKLFKVLW